MKRSVLLVALIASDLLTTGIAYALNGEDVLKKLDDAEYQAEDTVAEVKMVLVEKDGRTSERRLRIYQKGVEKRLIQFLEPADVKGIGFLDIGGGKMYVYLPAFHKIRRIAGHVKNENFAGTDFSYDDLSSKQLSKKLDALGMTEEREHYVLDTKPKPGEDSEYSKLKFWVRKADFLFDRVEYFDRIGTKSKEFTRKEFKPVGKYTQSFFAEIKDTRKQHATQMIVESLKCDTGLQDRMFSKRQLKRH